MSEQRHHAIDVKQQGSKSTSLVGDQARIFQIEGNLYYQEAEPEKAALRVYPSSPIPEPGLLLDREQDLRDVEPFFRRNSSKVLILEGLGGIGKTAFAAHACRTFRHEFQDIYWGNCAPHTSVQRVCQELYSLFARHDPSFQGFLGETHELSWQDTLQTLVQRLDQGKFLLVFDNVEILLDRDGRIYNAEFEEFFQLIIQAGHQSKLILISRRSILLLRQPAGIRMKKRLSGLTLAGTKIFLEKLGMRLIHEQARVLQEKVGGHPLALRIVADVYERGFSFQRIMAEPFRDLSRESAELCDELFSWIWERLTAQEREILQGFCTFRLPVPIEAVNMFGAPLPEFQEEPVEIPLLERLVRLLYEHCLLERKQEHEREDRYFAPELVHEVVFRNLSPPQQHTHHFKAAMYWVTQECCQKPLRHDVLQERQEAIYHSLQAGETEQTAKLALALADDLCRYGVGTLAQKVLLETEEALVSDDHRAAAYNQHGNIALLRGNLRQALQCYFQAREIWQRLNNQEGIATVDNNLGSVYTARGEYAEALRWYENTKNIFIQLRQEPGLAASYNNLGFVHACLGRYVIALQYHEKAREIQQRLHLEADLAGSYNNIGFLYDTQQEYELALEYYEQARQIRQRLHLEVDLAESYNNIGGVYKAQEHYKTAMSYYHQAREILERLGSEVNLARCYNNIGLVYTERGDLAHALEYYERARTIQQRLGLDVDLAKTYNNIGVMYAYQENEASCEIALEYYEWARQIQERLGLDMHLAVTLSNIGQVYYQQGAYQRAKHALELAIAIRKKLNEWDLESDLALLAQIQHRLFREHQWNHERLFNRLRAYITQFYSKRRHV